MLSLPAVSWDETSRKSSMPIDSAAALLAAVHVRQTSTTLSSLRGIQAATASTFDALKQEIASDRFRTAIASDLAEWSHNRKSGQKLDRTPFSALREELLLPRHHEALLWEAILLVIEQHSAPLYHQVHKGEPYYWMAIAAFESRDFERILYYMDCALAEDLEEFKDPPSEWYRWPAYLFVTFEDKNPNQAGQQIVRQLRKAFTDSCNIISMICPFDIQDYVAGLVWRALQSTGQPVLRSAVTAFTTFVLEHDDRRSHLKLAPSTRPGRFTCEIFTLHLFKGCVLLESLIASSSKARGLPQFMKRGDPANRTLGEFFKESDIYNEITVRPHKVLQGLPNLPLEVTFAAIKSTAEAQPQDTDTAYRVAWALRNMLGHSLAVPAPPTLDEYEFMFKQVFAALARTIKSLYPKDNNCPLTNLPIATSSNPSFAPPARIGGTATILDTSSTSTVNG
jgi:hypothetical protein